MLIRWVARNFDLSVVRARSTIRAAAFNLVFVASVTALKSATNALFLARRDPHHLPHLYLATAMVVAGVTAHLGRRLLGLSAKPVLRTTLVVSAGALGLLGVLAALDVRASLGVLYVVGEAYATAISVLFWTRLGEVFDVRAGKRVFGAIAAFGMAGAVIGGLLVGALARDVPAVTWCFVAAGSLVMMRPLLGAEQAPGSIVRERISFREGLFYAGGRGFPRGVAVLVLALSVLSAAVDFVFRTGTHKFEAGNEASMTALFGALNAVVGVLAIAFQMTLTSKLLSRLGVFAYLSVVPIACVAASGWAFVMPMSFAPLFVLKTFEMMGSYSLYQPGLQLLYNPMPTKIRGSVRALIDGAVKKLGGAVGGVLLIFFGTFFAQTELLAMVAAFGVLALVGVRILKPMYLRALEEKLGGTGAVKIPVIDPSERSTRQMLLKALREGNSQQALAAISVLESEPNFDFRPYVEALIKHPADAVRLKAVELIRRAPDPSYASLLAGVVTEDGKHSRAQAAQALMMVDPARARKALDPSLRSLIGPVVSEPQDRATRTAAIVALLGAPESGVEPAAIDSARSAMRAMLDRAKDRPHPERRELAQLIGMLGMSEFAPRLAEFLSDASPQVRAAAVAAAAHARDPSLPPLLVRMLNDRALHSAAIRALASYGDEVVDLLRATLDDRRLDLSLRFQVPKALRAVGTARAVNAMLFSNRHDDAYLRYVIIEELGRLRRAKPDLPFDRQQTQGAILRRLTGYSYYRPIAADLAQAPKEYALLYRAVEDRVRQNLQAALRLLGLLHDVDAMENAYRALMRRDQGILGDTLELIDVAIEGSEIRDRVMEALEPKGPLPEPGRARDRALALVEGRDVQLAMIAWETLRRAGEHPPEVREPTSGEPLMPKSILERVFLLQNVALFRDVSVDDLAAVAAITTLGHAEPRTVIYEEGTRGESMYVIISGEIHLLRGGRPLLDLHAGDSFGQTSILDGGPRPVTAKAGDEGVDFVRLERVAFMDLMADRPELTHAMLAELGSRIRELIELNGANHAHGERSMNPVIPTAASPAVSQGSVRQ